MKFKCLILKKKNDKKEGWFNWIFQIEVVVVRSASIIPRAFSDEKQNCFLLDIVKIKTNLKLVDAACCALPSNIIKYKSYVHLSYITSSYNMHTWFLLLYYKMTQMGNKFKKAKHFFCFTEYKYVAYLLNQHKQLTNGRNVYAFGQTSSPPSSLSRISTLLMEPNLKISTILLVLLYIRFKGRVKSQIWDSKLYPWLHRQVNHPLQRQMHLFLHIFETIFCAC